MRVLLPVREQREQEIERHLRTSRPAAIYARRSDPEAKDKNKDKSQSREMQTGDLLKWAIKQGWLHELLYEYFADLGLSGTLRPDQRADMLRLFDDIDAGKYDNGTIICYQENRLFRDETQIYYNQFIDKCLHHNIHVVAISPRLIIYDLRDDVLKEMLRVKLKEAAEFIPRHIKGWLHPARERAAWVYGEWAGLGNLPPGFIVAYDPKSPTYKMAIPYWPHIEKTREKFQLFMELGGDISLFYNRLRKSPIIYPEFASWVDKRCINAFKLSRYSGGGYYMKSKHSLANLLTHPLHYGYRTVNDVIRRDDQGDKIREFDPVIELELLDFAYHRLAKTDFDGNPIINGKPRRYFQQGNDGLYGLFKFRITSTQGVVRTRPHGEYDEDSPPNSGVYLIETINESDYVHHPEVDTAIPCEELEELETLWPDYTFEKRRTLINFVTKEVVIDAMSTHWLRVQVLWLHEEWGREEMFYFRRKGRWKVWTKEETELVRAHYASMSGTHLMALLPDRSWQSIRTRGKDTLGITRKTGRPTKEAVPDWATHYSYSDLAFMQERGIEGKTQNTKWVQQYPPPLRTSPDS